MRSGTQGIAPSASLRGRRSESSWDPHVDLSPVWRLILQDYSSLPVIHVGCGGTGSFLAGSIARLAHSLKTTGRRIEVTFVDPDTVAADNVGRQNFCPADVGRAKAEVISERYNRAYGWNSIAHTGRFGDWARECVRYRHQRGLIIGSVDTGSARREIAEWVGGSYEHWFWLDAGNHRLSGQVLLGSLRRKLEPHDRVEGVRIVKGLPLPSVQHPELLQDEPVTTQNTGSCAQRILRGEQGLFVNQTAAAVAAQYLHEILIDREVRRFATYFDLETGSMRSIAMTDKNLRRHSRRPRKAAENVPMARPLRQAA